MKCILARAFLCVLATAALTACGGGGGGSDGKAPDGSDLQNNTLYVSLSYKDAVVQLFGMSKVTPTASGFHGATPHCSLTGGSMPPGMVFNNDCSITGRPLKAGPFPFEVTITVAGFSGSVVTSDSVWIASPVVTYQSHTYPALPVGTALNDLPQVSGWTAPTDVTPTFHYSLASGALPPGIALDPTTGLISGKIGAQGSFSAGIAAMMTTAFGSYQLPVGNYAVNAEVGAFEYLNYNDGSQNVDVEGFDHIWLGISYLAAPYTSSYSNTTLSAFHVLSGTLPSGLVLDPATGHISGVPQEITAPTTVGVGATVTEWGVDNPTQANFKVRVDAPVLIGWDTPTTMPVNVPYILHLRSETNAIGFSGAVTSVAVPRTGSCILPPGLTMAGNGAVSGTPTAKGVFDCTVDFTLTVNGVSWGQQGQLTLTVQ